MKNDIRRILREDFIPEGRIKMDIPIPQNITTIKKVFTNNGYELFLVGGAVRDALLGKTPKDYDIATDAVPDEVERIMAEANIKTLPTGKENGVISAFLPVDSQLEEYEIATFRKDIGKGRRPDSVEFTTIDQDVKRRDLTINALFYNMDTHEVIDLVGGVEDLKNGIVRTVGNPADRFSEDRLRIMRAVRFAGMFGGQMEPEVDAALKRDNSLKGISGERIRDEFLKGIKKAKTVPLFINLISEYNLWDDIFPGLNVNKNITINDRDPAIVLATLLKDNDPKRLTKVLNTLKYSGDENKVICGLVKLQGFTDPNQVNIFKKLINDIGLDTTRILKFAMIAGIDQSLIVAITKFEFSVTGQQVQDELGVKPGPEMGNAIKKMEIDNFKRLL